MENNNIHKIKYQDKNIILVGTAHISKQSEQLVKEAIEYYQPENICIELDDDRLHSLLNPNQWKESNLVEIIKQKKAMTLLANTFLSSYQKRMAKSLDSEVGLEMMMAINLAKENNIPLTTIDRHVNITFKRIFRTLTAKDKIKLLSLFIDSIFDSSEEEISEEKLLEMMQEDLLTASLAEIRSEMPKIAEVLIDERDQYLAYKIKSVPQKNILAVVGAAHVNGIIEQLNQDIDIKKITEIPEKKPTGKYLMYLINFLLIAMLAFTFKKGFDNGLKAIINWTIFSGGFAALATMIMKSHPITTLATFISAPLTALNPMIAVGFIAALIQAHFDKPTVSDIENISEDITSFKGFINNKFLKALALVFVANLGSVIGQIISSLTIIRKFL